MSQYISTPNMEVIYTITEQGQTQPKTETRPSNNIPITETPIFVEEII